MVTVCFGEFDGMTYVVVVREQQIVGHCNHGDSTCFGEFDGMTYVFVVREQQIVGHCNHGDSLLW